MKILWKDIKDELRDLCFSNESEFDSFYLPKAYSAVNFALIDLAQSVCPIKKQYSISHRPLKNIAEGAVNFETRESGFCVYAKNAKAFYFECDGTGEIFLEKEENDTWVQLKIIKTTANKSFEAVRGFIDVLGRIRLRFSDEYLYNIRNVAFYAAVYSKFEDDIPEFSQFVEYDIKSLTQKSGGQDFLSFDERLPVYNESLRQPESRCAFAADCIVLLSRDRPGEYIISYNAYPQKITSQTPDSFCFDIEPNAARLIALYAACRLLKDEDPQKSAQYYNEYMQQKNQTYNQTPQNEVWVGAEEW